MRHFSKRFYGLAAGGLIVILLAGIVLYISVQSLVAQIIQGQIRQQGYPSAEIDDVGLYLDGIVIQQIKLNDQVILKDVFTPQSAPDIAKHGIRHLIVRQWEQSIAGKQQIPARWPFPHAESVSVENMSLHITLPQQVVTLSGTLKSLQPEAGNLVLLLPFDVAETGYMLQGKLEIAIEKGQISAIDINLDEGSYQSADLSLKRMSGWFNAQFADQAVSQIQAQFMAGSALYGGQNFADAMVQYSDSAAEQTQWTVNLNRAAENYFNSWVIKPTTDGRYAVQVASQLGNETKSAVMISGVPLQMVPLLLAQPQEPDLAE